MKTSIALTAKYLTLCLMTAFVLGGCATYEPAAQTQFGNYYDQYSPVYEGYPYPPGYYSYPYQDGYYGYPGFFGPSLYFGTSGGSSRLGIGTTFGW